MSGTILPTMCQFVGGDPVTQLTALCFPVIPLPSERVFNSATFKCRHIVLTTIINVSHLHLKNPKKKLYLFYISNCGIRNTNGTALAGFLETHGLFATPLFNMQHVTRPLGKVNTEMRRTGTLYPSITLSTLSSAVYLTKAY